MIEKNLRKNFLVSLSLVLVIFSFDRFSKIYIIYLDKKFLGTEIFTSKFLNFHLVWNEGVAFGLLSFDQKYLYNLLTILIGIIILIIIIMIKKNSGFKKISLTLILGGAIGNVFDRIIYRAVPDFIDFHVGNFHWFIFNVADIFISLGVIFMILSEFFVNKTKSHEKY